MKIVDIIEKKKNNKPLSKSEIDFFIKGLTGGSVADYQASALLMAICINGMDARETFFLTEAMINSGERLDTSFAGGVVCDKHSTGGVSDTVTPVVVPVVADAGLKVVKMSGRGLAHTGGTIDKMESIRGFNARLSGEQIEKAVKTCGAVIIEQSEKLAPADKILYALRDVTATVDSIPLIASSVMSKKLASGSDVILLDVKYGSGAFMKTPQNAVSLARLMVEIGVRYGKKCAALITSMRQPLTEDIGCNLEVLSALEVLKGRKNDLYALAKQICAKIFLLAGLYDDAGEAEAAFEKSIQSGSALNKFVQMIKCQGGDEKSLLELKPAGSRKTLHAISEGYVTYIDAAAAGRAVVALGGGRLKKGDEINKSVGVKFKLKINDYVKKGDAVAEIYYDDINKAAEAEKILNGAYRLGGEKTEENKLIYAYVGEKREIRYF
jgi:pyrimidine-nucleoside phosphorylase